MVSITDRVRRQAPDLFSSSFTHMPIKLFVRRATPFMSPRVHLLALPVSSIEVWFLLYISHVMPSNSISNFFWSIVDIFQCSVNLSYLVYRPDVLTFIFLFEFKLNRGEKRSLKNCESHVFNIRYRMHCSDSDPNEAGDISSAVEGTMWMIVHYGVRIAS